MKKHGIAVLGLNGCGKSTLAHALAKELGYWEIDVEDYYFPEQRESRRAALEGRYGESGGEPDRLPFSAPRDKEEVQRAILREMNEHPEFILSGVTVNWREELLSHIDLAFLLTVPAEERVRRVQRREEARFGSRVLEGGDMYEQQKAFREIVKTRDEKAPRESAARLSCPVIELDGRLAVEQNVEKIKEQIQWHRKSFC